jgi:hypothetical protein
MTSIEDLVKEFTDIDRPPVSDGIDLAHARLTTLLERIGCSVKVQSWPAEASTRWWDIKCPPPWTPKSGEVRLATSGGLVVSYATAPMSLPVNAPSTGGTTQVDRLGAQGGRAVFLTAEEATSDRLRRSEPGDIVLVAVAPRSAPTSEQVARFEAPHHCTVPVFSLPPRLWSEVRSRLAAGEKLVANADVDRRPADLSVVAGELRGEGGPAAPSVFVFAHSCHRAPNAIDNTSGLVAMLSLAGRAAERIGGSWRKRVQRVVFVAAPEIVGSAAWLSSECLASDFTGGVVLDMMAPRAGSEAHLLVDLPPSYVDPGGEHEARWPIQPEMFEARSDHLLTNSPAIGWPTVRLGYWPDPWNHTAADIASTVDLDGLLAGIDAADAALSAFVHHGTPAIRAERAGYPFDPRAFAEALPEGHESAADAALRRNPYGSLVRAAHRFSLGLPQEPAADPVWLELLESHYPARAALHSTQPHVPARTRST